MKKDNESGCLYNCLAFSIALILAVITTVAILIYRYY